MKNILKQILAIIVLIFCSLVLTFAQGFLSKPQAQETIVSNNQYSNIQSHLPIVIITTANNINKESYSWSSITILDQNNNHKTNSFKIPAKIKYRGQSSYVGFKKKQYSLQLYKKHNENDKNNVAIMGMSKESDWILNGPFLDRSLLRNKLMYDIAKQLLDYAPDCRFCEVFINKEYLGLYLMVEKIKVDKNRINLADFSLLNGATSYLIRRERPNAENNAINCYGNYTGYTSHELSISYPTVNKLLPSQKQWIINDINKFEQALYSDNFAHAKKGYLPYIDLNSFVDYYLINEFAMVKDAGFLSTYVYKNLAGKLKTTVWDFNNCLDNYVEPSNYEQFYVRENNWFKRLLQDKYFVKKIISRYKELRKDILNEQKLLNKIDTEIQYLGQAITRNYQVWQYIFNTNKLQKTQENTSRDPKSYDEAVKQLKQIIINRGKFLDANIEKLLEYVIN